jgi:hypothetical protein
MTKRERRQQSAEEEGPPAEDLHPVMHPLTVASRVPPHGPRLPRLPPLLLGPSASRSRRPAQIDHHLAVATGRGIGRRGNEHTTHHPVVVAEQSRR